MLLSCIDKAWQEQLREMDELRKSVQNASYEQKDPLVIYKLEAYELWKKMLWEMNSKSVATLMRGKLAVPDYAEAKAAEAATREAQEQRRQAMAQQSRKSAGNTLHRPCLTLMPTIAPPAIHIPVRAHSAEPLRM